MHRKKKTSGQIQPLLGNTHQLAYKLADLSRSYTETCSNHDIGL